LTLKGGSYGETKVENEGGIVSILRVIFVAIYLAVIAARTGTAGKESAGGKVFADGVR
jgi:hypothetical protein